jgi:hypothetical protein
MVLLRGRGTEGRMAKVSPMRQPDFPPDIGDRLVEKACGLGFPVYEPIVADQSPTTCVPRGSP